MKVLLIVDVQAVFMVNPKLKKLPLKINNLILNGSFNYVIGARFINHKNSCFVKKWNWKKSMLNDNESQIDPNILKHCDFVFNKKGFSCFTSDFKKIMKSIKFNKKIDQIYICGLDTDLCVQITCADLFINNYDIYLLSNYCGSDAGNEFHIAGLKILGHMLGLNRIIKDI